MVAFLVPMWGSLFIVACIGALLGCIATLSIQIVLATYANRHRCLYCGESTNQETIESEQVVTDDEIAMRILNQVPSLHCGGDNEYDDDLFVW